MNLIDMTDEEFEAYRKEKGAAAVMQEFEDQGYDVEIDSDLLDTINGGGMFCKVILKTEDGRPRAIKFVLC